jgi:hypothetical protein
MQEDMARRIESHNSAGQFGSRACVAVELGCGRRKRILEWANLRWSRFLTSRICAGCRQLISCVSVMRCPAVLRINMQLYFSFMTPLLPTICGYHLLALGQ